MPLAFCPTCHTYPETLLSYPIIGIDAEGDLQKIEEGVFLTNNGTPTGQYADGSFGVPREVREVAEEDEEPLCAECFNYVDWRHKE